MRVRGRTGPHLDIFPNRGRQLKKANHIRHRGTVLSDRAPDLGVTEAVHVHENMVPLGLFHGVQSLALKVLHESEDQERALRWFKLAADQGYHPAAEALADLYTDTDDPSYYAEAIELYRRAADSAGSAWAVLRLGMIHAIGEGVGESDSAARAWFSKLGSGFELDPDPGCGEMVCRCDRGTKP